MTERSRKLAGSEHYIELFRKSSESRKNIAFVGPVFAGKSAIAKEFAASSTSCAYVDLSKIGLSPEEFAVNWIRHLSSWFLKKDIDDINSVKDSLPAGCSDAIDQVLNELLKIKPNHYLLVELALNFPELLGKERQFVVCVDEFWRILDLNNFDQIPDVISMFKRITSAQPHTSFILIGSAVQLMKLQAAKLGYEIVTISGLSAKDVGEEMHHYTSGIPLYVNAVKKRMEEKYTLREAFLIEALFKGGVVYNACNYKLESSLARARGKALLFSILKILCKSNGLRLNEISKKVYRSSAVTKNLLERLMSVDLVAKDGNLYSFSDAVLRFWFSNFADDREFDSVPDKNTLKKIEVDI